MTVQPAPRNFQEQYLRFLGAEETAKDRLVDIYAQARAEFVDFLESAEAERLILTASEQQFYNAVNEHMKQTSALALNGATTWANESIALAYVEGAYQHADDIAFGVVHDQAVRELSGYTLDQVTAMSADMRRSIQQTIGVSILEGLSSQAIRERLIQTGMTNIPRWRSIEERAGVIARTEVMRAYNAGNLAGIAYSGAIAIRWIASPDEAVCPICAPRAGKDFRLPGMKTWPQDTPPEAVEAWRGLEDVEPPPAHPRCRCTIRAQYRLGEKKVGTGQAPKPREGGVIEATPTPAAPPSAATEWDDLVAGTKAHRFPTTEEYERAKRAWRDAVLDEGRLRKMAAFDDDALAFAVDGRYGVSLEVGSIGAKSGRAWKTWQNPEFRYHLLNSIEQVRLATPRFAVESSYFRRLQIVNRSVIRKRNVLADCSPTGALRVNMSTAPEYLTQGVRSSANGIEEILVHEIGHSVHNRFGFAGYGFQSIEAAGDDVYAAWYAIRAKTGKAIYSPEQVPKLQATVASAEARIATLERVRDEWDTIATVRITKRRWNYQIGGLEDYEIELKQITIDGREYSFATRLDVEGSLKWERDTLKVAQDRLTLFTSPGDKFPTEYAQRGGLQEDFAESFMLFLIDAERLKAASPLRYNFMRDLVSR